MTLRILIAACLFYNVAISQVGIGTITPDVSSVFDVSSSTRGLLIPRMTTTQRNSIVSPAESLLVFDTDLDSFYFYNTTTSSWNRLSSINSIRDNYVLVKSMADLPTPSGGKITLDAATYYEINGTITLTAPIDLNNAYVSGLDANEDILSFPGGTIFEGSTGGSVRNLTLRGSKAFAINGPGLTSATSVILQNTIVDAMTTSVGSISNVGLFFGNIVQFTNNTDGITYQNIGNLLLNNMGWFASNNGTFEKVTGVFGLIEKVSGFSSLDGSDIAFDVSANPTVGNGVIFGTVFSGSTTAPSGFINRYTSGSYTGYSFSNVWTVNCPGIPKESDDVSTGNYYYNGSLTMGFSQSITNNTAVKVVGTGATSANNLFRFSAPVTNNLTYMGKKTRNFQINASISMRVTGAAGDFYALIMAKNGVVVTESNAVVRIDSDSEIQNVAINTIVSLAPNDYVEIYVQRLTGMGTDTLVVFSENLSIK